MPEEMEAAAAPDSAAKAPKVWTESEVDAYVKARIDKQAGKYAEQLAAKDQRIADLEATATEAANRIAAYEAKQQQAEWAEQVARETGVPASILRGSSLEELQAHAEAIKAAGRSIYPPMQDGSKPGPVHFPSKSRKEIAAIKDNRERLAAIRDNLAAYE